VNQETLAAQWLQLLVDKLPLAAFLFFPWNRLTWNQP